MVEATICSTGGGIELRQMKVCHIDSDMKEEWVREKD